MRCPICGRWAATIYEHSDGKRWSSGCYACHHCGAMKINARINGGVRDVVGVIPECRVHGHGVRTVHQVEMNRLWRCTACNSEIELVDGELLRSNSAITNGSFDYEAEILGVI